MDALAALRHLTQTVLPARHAMKAAALPPGEVPWEDVARLAIQHGVASLVAYNMEYRLSGGDAPEAVRDQLLGFFHGAAADNVFKLVELRKLLSEVQVPVLLVESAAYVDALYPHAALRPVADLHLFVRREDHFAFARAAQPLGVAVQGKHGDRLTLTDGRLRYQLHEKLLDAGAFERGVPAKEFGETVRRPCIEDAVLSQVALLGEVGVDVPLIELVDLRELVLGSPAQGSTWSAPPDAPTVVARAQERGLSRALFCAMALTGHYFPEAASAAKALMPDLGLAARVLLEATVLTPARRLERSPVTMAFEELKRRLLAFATFA